MPENATKALIVLGLALSLPVALFAQGGPPPGGPPGGPPSATVQVDCAAGDSIQAALNNPAQELTIEISGICDQYVEVTRSNVILRGATDPSPDALTTPLPDGIHFTGSLPIENALLVKNTFFVTIESLSLTGGTSGLSVNNSFAVRLTNCRLEDSGFAGAFVNSARVTMVDTLVTGNASRGVRVGNAGFFTCLNCTIENNPGGGERFGRGVELQEGSALVLRGTRIAGDARGIQGGGTMFVGVLSFLDGAAVPLIASSISSSPSTSPEDPNPGFGFSFDLDFGATLAMDGFGGGEITPQIIEGPIRLRRNSHIQLRDVTQTIPGGFNSGNQIVGHSSLEASRSTTLVGDLQIFGFSSADLRDPATVLGSLNCSTAGDASCNDPAVTLPLGGTTSNCGQCMKP